jgi:3'(2'), 5'-bisphosphate nucleotidase
MKDAHDLLSEVKLLSIKAGEAILTFYQAEFEVKHKADQTPVTAADIAAHDIIVAGLQQLTPDIPVLSEESTAIDFSVRSSWDRYWLVDPLDGTKEFVKGNSGFSVNIALIDKHMSILGVIYCPVDESIYFAVKNVGAFKAEKNQPETAINVSKMMAKNIRIAGSRSHIGPSCQDFLGNFKRYRLIRVGSSLKSCLVAEGLADVYPRFGPTSEWDTAAAQCIVEEAGGMLVDINMQPLRYNTKDSLLNPYFIVVGDKDVDWPSYLPEFDGEETGE